MVYIHEEGERKFQWMDHGGSSVDQKMSNNIVLLLAEREHSPGRFMIWSIQLEGNQIPANVLIIT